MDCLGNGDHMKYVFYESFYYSSNTSRMRTKTWLTNRVEVYTNPQESLVSLMIKRHGSKHASFNKNTDKLYVRERVRRATVKYKNQTQYHDPEFEYSYSENKALGINFVKDFDQKVVAFPSPFDYTLSIP